MLVKEMLRYSETGPFIIGPQQPLADALALMAENHIGVLVVMKGEKLVGMLTHRELINAIYKRRDIEHAPIADFMINEPVTATPEMHIDDLRRLMVEKRCRYLPVLEEGVLKGAISFLDVAKAVIDAQDLENKMLKHYIRHWPEEEQSPSTSA